MDLDDLFPHIGQFGICQILLFFMMLPYAFFQAFVYFSATFVMATPEEHFCRVPELAHLKMEDRLHLAIPPSTSKGAFKYSQCLRYDVNFTSLVDENGTLSLTPNPNWPVKRCDKGWEYDYSEIPYPSATVEFEWVCKREAIESTAHSLHFVGSVMGCLLTGWGADRFGRIPALVCSNMYGFVGGLVTAFAKNEPLFLFGRILVGMADNCFTIMYIIVLEYVGPKWRTFVTNISMAFFFCIGSCIMPWIAYYIADWRMFSVVISAPMAVALLAPCTIPESARWLISQGKKDRALKTIKMIAKINRKKVDESVYENFLASQVEGPQKKYSIIDLFRSANIRKNTLLLILIWMGISIGYDGHVKNIKNTGWNLFLTFTIAGATECPADILLFVTLDAGGRRFMGLITLVFSGLFSYASVVAPLGVISAILAIMGRFFINISFNIGLQYAAELLPTVVRGQGLTFIHVFGHIASAMTPYIAQSATVFQPMPLLIIGTVTIISGVLVLFLPETTGKVLPQTIADGESFGKNQKFCHFPFLKSTESA